MVIREYKSSYCKEVSELFYNTVHVINAKDYTREQLDVWATNEIDLEKFNKSLIEHYSLVAFENKIIIGFGDIDETGYLDRLFVHKDYQNRGVATAICNRLEEKILKGKIITHSPITAKKKKKKRGYRIIREQQVERKGLFLINYIMEKII